MPVKPIDSSALRSVVVTREERQSVTTITVEIAFSSGSAL